jgi:hypothetical protein
MVCDTMALTEHYRGWEDREDYFTHGGKIYEISNRNWIDVIDVLKQLSYGYYCDLTDIKRGTGNTSGLIEICNGWLYGEIRWDIRDPVMHNYGLQYEIEINENFTKAYFELHEGVLLPIDTSYIPSIMDYLTFKFPGCAIMTKRIHTFDYYQYAI